MVRNNLQQALTGPDPSSSTESPHACPSTRSVLFTFEDSAPGLQLPRRQHTRRRRWSSGLRLRHGRGRGQAHRQAVRGVNTETANSTTPTYQIATGTQLFVMLYISHSCVVLDVEVSLGIWPFRRIRIVADLPPLGLHRHWQYCPLQLPLHRGN